jgi:hypothetical protein
VLFAAKQILINLQLLVEESGCTAAQAREPEYLSSIEASA